MVRGNRESGEVRLTLAGKMMIMLVGLAILGFAGWRYRDRLPINMPFLGGAGETPGQPSATVPDSSAGSGGGVLARITASGTLRVGMEPDAPPLHFLNDRRQEDGFDFRLAAVIADGLGVPRVQVTEADYEDLPGLLQRGEIDVIMAGYVPDPSIGGVIWSQGYLDFGLCMIVQEGMAWSLKSPSDLAGKRVAIYDDPAAERWVNENIPNARVSKFSGDSGWFEAVENGQADALIYDYPFAAAEIKEHPRTTIVKYNLNQSQYAVGVAVGNYDLVYKVNETLGRFMATPEYAKLMQEYLASSSDVFMQPVEGRKTYTVQPGDTLTGIAQARLGSLERWEDIWRLNSDRVANPNLIYPRLVLLMP